MYFLDGERPGGQLKVPGEHNSVCQLGGNELGTLLV